MTDERALVPEDLYRLRAVADPQISPDGTLVAFVVRHVAEEDKEYRSRIWVVPTCGGEAKPWTAGPKDVQPRWSPDGTRLAFTRQPAHDAPPIDRQIWVIDREGGEARPLTWMRYGASAPLWSPDGRWIAFISPAGADDEASRYTAPMSLDERKQEEEEAKNRARLIARFRYKSDAAGLHVERYDHVWVVPVPERLTGEAADAPVPRRVAQGPFDYQILDWSPDLAWIAVACNREDERKWVRDIWLFPTDVAAPAEAPRQGAPAGTGAPPDIPEPIRLTDGAGMYGDAAWSPDGERIAVVGHTGEYGTATLHRLWLYPHPGRPRTGGAGQGPSEEPVCLTEAFDRGLDATINADVRGLSPWPQVAWAPDGDALYVLATDAGTTHIHRVALADRSVSRVTQGEREVYGFSLARAGGGRIVMAAADMFDPGDLHALDLPSGEERRLTDVNAWLKAEIARPVVEEIRFLSRDGTPVHGWIMLPVGRLREDGPFPTALEIHGGPHTCYGHSFMLEFHLLAAWGYAVVFVNPRGSTGYGQAFERACQGDYGGGDAEDLLAALDHAVAAGVADPSRLAVTGGSYGGFMTNWLLATSDRFRAGIAHRSVSNWISFWGVSDIGPNFCEAELQIDSLWDDVETLWDRSPLKRAGHIDAPLLICHSENDLRCPIEQAEQLYVALKWEGKEVEFLRHPRSNHDLTREGPPMLRVDRFDQIRRFLAKHVPAGSGG